MTSQVWGDSEFRMCEICKMNVSLVTSLVRGGDPVQLGRSTQSQIWLSGLLFTAVGECENRSSCHKVGLSTLAVGEGHWGGYAGGCHVPIFSVDVHNTKLNK